MGEARILRLKDVATVRISTVDKQSNEVDPRVRLCNYVDVYYNERITADLNFMEATATRNQIRQFGLRKGDVLITKDSETPDDIGVPALVVVDEPDLVCGYHLAMVRPNIDVVDPGYLYLAMAAAPFRQQLSAAATGVTRFGLRDNEIKSATLRVPDLGEQRRISEMVSREFRRMDEIEGYLARTGELMSERRVAMITAAATGEFEAYGDSR